MKKYLIKDKLEIFMTIKDINDILKYNDAENNLYVSFSELGFSVFTKKSIKKGQLIYLFQGELIDYEETKMINDDTGECRALQFDDNKYINTNAPGRYINHSCDPNAGIRNKFELIAIKDINENSEIRFDYSTTMDEDDFTMECMCGSNNCRKIVDDFKKIPVDRQKEYIEMGIVSEFILQKLKLKVNGKETIQNLQD